MTDISLGGNTLTRVIDTLFSETSVVAIPEWVNSTPDLDMDIWSKKPLTIVYVVRVTDAMKWILDQILLAHTAINLTDTKYSINANYWLRSITATWEGSIHYAEPWGLELELIKV